MQVSLAGGSATGVAKSGEGISQCCIGHLISLDLDGVVFGRMRLPCNESSKIIVRNGVREVFMRLRRPQGKSIVHVDVRVDIRIKWIREYLPNRDATGLCRTGEKYCGWHGVQDRIQIMIGSGNEEWASR